MALRDHDERWDQFALAHVLGGLPAADASAFRAHLAGCGQCRARVAELRSLDTEMAAAEREERAARRLRTRVEEPSGQERELDAPDDEGRRRWQGLALVMLVMVLLFGLSLWNAHLRTQNAQLSEMAELQQQTLRALGGGTVVPVRASEAVTGVVGVDGERVAVALAGLPAPDAGEWLVVWLRHPDGIRSVKSYPAPAMQAGRLETTLSAVGDATALVITVEPADRPPDPAGRQVLEADLVTG